MDDIPNMEFRENIAQWARQIRRHPSAARRREQFLAATGPIYMPIQDFQSEDSNGKGFHFLKETNMISRKGKRRIEYEGNLYYWYVRVNDRGHRVHILSEDRKIHLEYPFLDTELPVTPKEIRDRLKAYHYSDL